MATLAPGDTAILRCHRLSLDATPWGFTHSDLICLSWRSFSVEMAVSPLASPVATLALGVKVILTPPCIFHS
jgi:hypothetical protein